LQKEIGVRTPLEDVSLDRTDIVEPERSSSIAAKSLIVRLWRIAALVRLLASSTSTTATRTDSGATRSGIDSRHEHRGLLKLKKRRVVVLNPRRARKEE
jgi:hypothetical protein